MVVSVTAVLSFWLIMYISWTFLTVYIPLRFQFDDDTFTTYLQAAGGGFLAILDFVTLTSLIFFLNPGIVDSKVEDMVYQINGIDPERVGPTNQSNMNGQQNLYGPYEVAEICTEKYFQRMGLLPLQNTQNNQILNQTSDSDRMAINSEATEQ